MKNLKGGLEGFAGLENLKIQVPDFESEVNQAAENVETKIFLMRCAYETVSTTWGDYFESVRRMGCYDEESPWPFLRWWHCHYREEAVRELKKISEDLPLADQLRMSVPEAVIGLVEAMGKWFDNLSERAKNKNRYWLQEYKRFCAMHKNFARKYQLYVELIGKEVPII